MSKHTRKFELRKQARDIQAQTATARKAFVGDSFQNFVARAGLGAGSQNDASRYGFDFISRNRVQMEAVYRSSWIAGQVVDVVAQDMTRAGVEIHSDMPPDDIETLNKAFDTHNVWEGLDSVIKWSRLYGGAVGVILIDGQNVSTPFRPETVGKGQFKGILPLDRWVAMPSLDQLVTDYGPDFGKPKYYDVTADAQALRGMRIHYSRVIRLDGVELPYWQKIAENGWGQSVLERLWDRLIAFDSTTTGAAQLVYKAHLRTIRVDKLREIIAMGGPALEAVAKQFDMIRAFQSNEGITLLDKEDEFQTHSYTFSGLDSLLLQFGQQLSGATGIPLVRLFGQSPAGLNSTGESDLRTYYDGIAQQQDRKLRNGLAKLLDVMQRSELGREPDPKLSFEFRPLWQLTDEQKANIAKTVSDSVTAVYDSGIIERPTALKELRQSSHVTGIWSNITDEDIEAAENDPPPGMGEDDDDQWLTSEQIAAKANASKAE